MNTKYKFFQMDKSEFSAYHDTYDEILLQDGILLQIESVEEVVYPIEKLMKLPFVKEWGFQFTEEVKYHVINMV